MITYVCLKICMQMFTEALFVTVKIGSNTTSINWWMDEHIVIYHTVESYPGVKGKPTTGPCDNVNESSCITSCERSQAQRNICNMIPFLWNWIHVNKIYYYYILYFQITELTWNSRDSDRIKASDCQDENGILLGVSTEVFWSDGNFVSHIWGTVTWPYSFAKIHPTYQYCIESMH